jgi:hypothetical protein
MILLNTLLVRKLIKSKQITNRQLKKEHNFAFTVIFLNAFFVITLLPSAIILIGSNIVGYKDATSVASKSATIMNFAFVVGQYFAGFNYTFSFLLNLKFNKLFRKEFFLMIVDIKKLFFRNQQVFSTGINTLTHNSKTTKNQTSK